MSSKRVFGRTNGVWCGVSAILLALACSSSDDGTSVTGASPVDLASRAYVISEESNELFIVDLSTMNEVGKVDTSVTAAANAAAHAGQRTFLEVLRFELPYAGMRVR